MMLEPMQVLLLWKLLVTDGEQWLADIQPKTISANRVRRRLREDGFITEEKQKREVDGKRPVNATKLFLDDKGWAWISENMGAKLPQSKAAADVLQAVLGVLDQYLKNNNLALVDLFARAASVTLEQQIVEIYKELDQYSRGERVKISDIFSRMSNVDLPAFHRALEDMQAAGALTLYPLDNPREISDEDRRTELTTSMGTKRHIVYMSGK